MSKKTETDGKVGVEAPTLREDRRINTLSAFMTAFFVRVLSRLPSKFHLQFNILSASTLNKEAKYSIRKIEASDGTATWYGTLTPCASIEDTIFGPKGLITAVSMFLYKAVYNQKSKTVPDVFRNRVAQAFRDMDSTAFRADLAEIIREAKEGTESGKKKGATLLEFRFHGGDSSELSVRTLASDDENLIRLFETAEAVGATLMLVDRKNGREHGPEQGVAPGVTGADLLNILASAVPAEITFDESAEPALESAAA